MNMLSKVVKNKKFQMVTLCCAMMIMTSVGCFADTGTPAVTDPVKVITDSFADIVTKIMLILAAIGGSAVAIKAVMLGWQYGNKIFRKATN